MKTERELFEKLPDIKAILQSGFQFNEDLNQYYHLDHTSHRLNYAFLMGAWLGWQSSASREGYKLVPLEPNEAMLEALQVGFKPDYEGGSYDSYEGYKAMMGVGE